MKGEKCKEIQDRCIDEIYQIVIQLDLNERNILTMEYLDNYKTSKRVTDFLLNLIY